jgi:hypothetical protein
MCREKLAELVERFLEGSDGPFFPGGVYGGSAYVIDEDGFMGPLDLMDYPAPCMFTIAAEAEFRWRVRDAGLSLEDSSLEQLAAVAGRIDLSYGHSRALEPETFVRLLQSGCVAETYYLILGDLVEVWDFDAFVERAIVRTCGPDQVWEDLDDGEVREWVGWLEGALQSRNTIPLG